MALKGALRSYAVVRDLITPELEPLVLSHLKNIRESVAEAFGVSLDSNARSSSTRRVRWGAKEIGDWVAGLTELVTRFEERVEILLQACVKVENDLVSLSKVAYEKELFSTVVENIQKTVDELSLAGYTKLNSWVLVIKERMGDVLRARLENSIEAWITTFEKEKDSDSDEEKMSTLPKIKVPTIGLEILLRNQEISASPSLPSIRIKFLQELHDYMGVVCTLKSPQSGRFEVFDSNMDESQSINSTFGHLAREINPVTLAQAYGCIEVHMHYVSDFVSQWLAYQTLWDTRVVDVASAIGDDMNLWHSVLDEAAAARRALDSSREYSQFGPIVVKFDKVQSQINLKYDSWQKELQTCYAGVLGKRIEELHDEASRSKVKLEEIALDGGAATEDIVLGVTSIQDVVRKIGPWGEEITSLLDAERLLKRQRHSFGTDWLEGSRLKGQYHQLMQILHKRSRSMNDQLPLLQSRIISEDKVADQRIEELLGNWEEEKPLRGNIQPREALELLSKYEFTMKKAKADDDNLLKAKDALGLDVAISNNAIAYCYEELVDLKEVWSAMSDPHEKLDKIKESPWSTVVTRQIRKQLEDIVHGKTGNFIIHCVFVFKFL
jgi:dynein heavy chain 1